MSQYKIPSFSTHCRLELSGRKGGLPAFIKDG